MALSYLGAVVSLWMPLLALATGVSSSSSSSSSSSPSATCNPDDYNLPNPIATTYPGNVTGLINATLLVIPIPLDTARRITPSSWPILTNAYAGLLPATILPEGTYPLVLQAVLDHDIQVAAANYSTPDFARVGLQFPFLDLLGDGYSTFCWQPHLLIQASSDVPLAGAAAYGIVVEAATMEPPCAAYAYADDDDDDDDRTKTAFAATGSQSSSVALHLVSSAKEGGGGGDDHDTPALLRFFRNATQQPLFGNGSSCDSQLRFFDTAAFFPASPYTDPRAVRGTVRLANLFDGQPETTFAGVVGLQVATPFLENNYLACSSLAGFVGGDLPGS